MASIWEKDISILAGNLNSGRSYLQITAVLNSIFLFQVTSHPKKLMLPRTDARVGDQVPVVNPGEIQWQAGKFPAFILNFRFLSLERFDEKMGKSISLLY